MTTRRNLFIAMLACATGNALQAARKPDDAIILGYSRSGTTLRLARAAQEITGAPLIEIELKDPYPPRYSDMTEIVKREVETGASRAIATEIPSLTTVKTVILATPIWWNGLSVPMRSLLRQYPLAGKRVIALMTSGGSDAAGAMEQLRSLCPGAQLEPVFLRTASQLEGAKEALRDHLRRLGFRG